MGGYKSYYGEQRKQNQKVYKSKLWSLYLRHTHGKPGKHSEFREWVLANKLGWEPKPGTLVFKNPEVMGIKTEPPPKQWVSEHDHAKQTTRNPKYGSKSRPRSKASWQSSQMPSHIPYHQTLTAQHRLPPPPPPEHAHQIDMEGLTFDDRCYLHSILDPQHRYEEYQNVRTKNLVQMHKRRHKNVVQDEQRWRTCITYNPH